MVDDILLTPEEQDERAKQWLKDNGMALVLGIGLGLAAVFGYNSYQDKQRTDAESASELYQQALSAIQNSEISDISPQIEELKSEYASTPYASKASLLRAKQLVITDPSEAVAEYQWVQENSSEIGVIHAARIRQAKVLLSQGELDKAKELASQLPDDGFTSNYQEILGDIATKQSEYAIAANHYQAAMDSLSERELNYRAILDLKRKRLPIDLSEANESEASGSQSQESIVEDSSMSEG